MAEAASKLKSEGPGAAAKPCLAGKPYQMLVFDRIDGNKVPVYFVAGVAGGPWNSRTALTEAFGKHGGQCHYCKKAIEKDKFSIDHVEPKCCGGSDSIQNLVISHKACNVNKGRLPIEAFHPEAGKEWLQALLKQVQQRLSRLG
jgi:5-methylcytosine-specific restriction endonuclease McrA